MTKAVARSVVVECGSSKGGRVCTWLVLDLWFVIVMVNKRTIGGSHLRREAKQAAHGSLGILFFGFNVCFSAFKSAALARVKALHLSVHEICNQEQLLHTRLFRVEIEMSISRYQSFCRILFDGVTCHISSLQCPEQ